PVAAPGELRSGLRGVELCQRHAAVVAVAAFALAAAFAALGHLVAVAIEALHELIGRCVRQHVVAPLLVAEGTEAGHHCVTTRRNPRWLGRCLMAMATATAWLRPAWHSAMPASRARTRCAGVAPVARARAAIASATFHMSGVITCGLLAGVGLLVHWVLCMRKSFGGRGRRLGVG